MRRESRRDWSRTGRAGRTRAGAHQGADVPVPGPASGEPGRAGRGRARPVWSGGTRRCCARRPHGPPYGGRRCRERGRTTGNRQEPVGSRGLRDGAGPRGRGFRDLLRIPCPSDAFHVTARLFRNLLGVARCRAGPPAQLRAQLPAPIHRTCCSSMTCSASPTPKSRPQIDPDARRRRFTALLTAAAARGTKSGVRHRGRALDRCRQ